MDLLRSIISSDWFVIVAIVWGVIAIANRKSREIVLETVVDLITKPIIFQPDSDPRSVKPYARQLLETLAKLLTSGVFGVTNRLIQVGRSSRKRNEERFSRDETSFWKMMGSVILFIAMLAFLYADLIAIFNTLEVLGLVTNIPEIFRPYEYAITFGSFFTIVLAGLLLIEIFGRPTFTDTANQLRPAKLLLTWISLILVISGLGVAVSLGLIRYRALSDLDPVLNANLTNFNNLVLTILVPANTIISTFLIVSEGLKGIPIVGLLIVQMTISVAVTVLFVFVVINYLLWFALDIAYRMLLVGLYLLFFFVLTPLDSILTWKPFAGEIANTSDEAVAVTENPHGRKQ